MFDNMLNIEQTIRHYARIECSVDRGAHESVLGAAIVGVPDEDGLVKPEAFD